VVCTFNRAEVLRRAISSLLALECFDAFTFEVVVVDDRSTDNTPEVVAGFARQVIPVRYVVGTGTGVAAARNTGVAASGGRLIAFFDDDQLAEKNWLIELWRLQIVSGAACAGGPRALLFEDPPAKPLPRATRLILGEIPADGNVRRYERDGLFCAGNMMVKRRVFDAVGGFDPSLLQGGEDTDLFRRMREAGHECWFTPAALVHHMIPPYRLELKYLHWTAVRGGHCYAQRDLGEWGPARTVAIAALRLAHGVILHGGRWLLGRATRNSTLAVAGHCHLARAIAYAREAISALRSSNKPAPASTEFRSERVLFAESKHLDG
jgi:glycosyltransferase involved in cell wall biosynthesis